MQLTSIDDFDELPTVLIPRETMHQLVYGEGHAPSGPDRPTRDLRPLDLEGEDLSDGVPLPIERDASTERAS